MCDALTGYFDSRDLFELFGESDRKQPTPAIRINQEAIFLI